jgi:cytochrome c oxidase cbb3-type subunit 3
MSRAWDYSILTASGLVAGILSLAQGPGSAAGQSGTSTPPALIAHPEHVHPGLPDLRPAVELQNPRERDPRAVPEGKALFLSYNCVDCHGADGSGAMGPSLADGRWHFGGTAGEVYESIAQGRPSGMPAWGGRIPNAQIWALVAYVRSLDAGANVSTDNFEGATVERSGH